MFFFSMVFVPFSVSLSNIGRTLDSIDTHTHTWHYISIYIDYFWRLFAIENSPTQSRHSRCWKPIHFPPPSQACSEHASHWERKREKEIQMEVQQKAAKVIFGCFQKYGCFPQNGWFINGKPLLKWIIWGGNPLFSETSIFFQRKWCHFCGTFDDSLRSFFRSFGGPAVWIGRKSHHLAQKRSLTERCQEKSGRNNTF